MTVCVTPRWEFTEDLGDRRRLQSLLNEGWEPFATCGHSVCCRRIAPEGGPPNPPNPDGISDEVRLRHIESILEMNGTFYSERREIRWLAKQLRACMDKK